jgi:hypothetical protein
VPSWVLLAWINPPRTILGISPVFRVFGVRLPERVNSQSS